MRWHEMTDEERETELQINGIPAKKKGGLMTLGEVLMVTNELIEARADIIGAKGFTEDRREALQRALNYNQKVLGEMRKPLQVI